jgi:putative tricarboxylic transport membrane protein
MRIGGFDALDLVGGLIVFAGGCAVAIGATTYPVGILHRMGPGYFPLVTGVILAAMGLGLVFVSRTTTSTLAGFRFRPMIAVFAGLIFMGLTLERFGVVPATVGLVVLVSLAQEKPSLVMIAATAAFLVAFCVVVFVYALALPIAMIRY